MIFVLLAPLLLWAALDDGDPRQVTLRLADETFRALFSAGSIWDVVIKSRAWGRATSSRSCVLMRSVCD